jgi:hypothetical protein
MKRDEVTVQTANLCAIFSGCDKCPGHVRAGDLGPGNDKPDELVFCIHGCHMIGETPDLPLSLFHDLLRVFVVSQSNEACMPQMIGMRPLQKAELSYGFRPEPDAAPHLGNSQSLASATGILFREVDEGADISSQRLQRCMHLAPRDGNKAVTNAGTEV